MYVKKVPFSIEMQVKPALHQATGDETKQLGGLYLARG